MLASSGLRPGHHTPGLHLPAEQSYHRALGLKVNNFYGVNLCYDIRAIALLYSN